MNGAELARAFGVSEPTVRHYLDILAASCMVRILPPWHENVGKRQVKAPKIYLADPAIGPSVTSAVIAEATPSAKPEPLACRRCARDAWTHWWSTPGR